MAEPVTTQKFPYAVELEPGQYTWCACGRSRNQPFCDGSHQGTGIEPVNFTIQEAGKVYLCACRHSKDKPFCDGSHNDL